MGSPENNGPLPAQTEVENISVREPGAAPDRNRISLQTAQLLITPGTNEDLARMQVTSDVSPHLTNIALDSKKARKESVERMDAVQAVTKAAEALKARKQLTPNSDESALIRDAIEKTLIIGGLEAARRLDKTISDELPPDMKLRFSKNRMINRVIQERAEKLQVPIPDFSLAVELIQKQNYGSETLLGEKFGIAVNSPAQAIAIEFGKLGNDKPLQWSGQEATHMRLMMEKRFDAGGAAEADKLVAEISENLPEGMHFRFVEGQEFNEFKRNALQTIRAANETGQKIGKPSYLRLIELVRDGEKLETPPRFGVVFTDPITGKPQEQQKDQLKQNAPEKPPENLKEEPKQKRKREPDPNPHTMLT